MLAISAKLGWKIKQFDIATAFLYRSIDRHFYITQPKGFEWGERLTCLLNIALHGLVQSAYLWFSDLKAILKDFGLFQSKHDDALFHDTSYSLYITVWYQSFLSGWRHDSYIENASTVKIQVKRYRGRHLVSWDGNQPP